MIKLAQILVLVLYWLQLFFVPFFLCGLAGFFIMKEISIPVLVIGAVPGIILAEYVRRKIGLIKFFAGIYSSTPGNINDKNNGQ